MPAPTRKPGAVPLLALAGVLAVMPVISSPGDDRTPGMPTPGRGKKKLMLFAKNPSNWTIVKHGGSGTLTYSPATGTFTLTAAGVLRRTSYALVRYADAPPNAEILARGTSDERGRLAFSGVWRNWTRKFWLVSGEDVAGAPGQSGSFRAWRPERYLFEQKQLGIACACPEPEEP